MKISLTWMWRVGLTLIILSQTKYMSDFDLVIGALFALIALAVYYGVNIWNSIEEYAEQQTPKRSTSPPIEERVDK